MQDVGIYEPCLSLCLRHLFHLVLGTLDRGSTLLQRILEISDTFCQALQNYASMCAY